MVSECNLNHEIPFSKFCNFIISKNYYKFYREIILYSVLLIIVKLISPEKLYMIYKNYLKLCKIILCKLSLYFQR